MQGLPPQQPIITTLNFMQHAPAMAAGVPGAALTTATPAAGIVPPAPPAPVVPPQPTWWHPSGVQINITNVTSRTHLGCQVNTQFIAGKAKNAEYNSKKDSVFMKIIRPVHAKGVVFGSGKLVVTGCKSAEEAKIAAYAFVDVIEAIGPAKPKKNDVLVQNLVATCQLPFAMALERMYLSNVNGPYPGTYEPEIFPGLIIKLRQPKLTVYVFASGKVTFSGARVIRDIHMAFEKLWTTFEEYAEVDDSPAAPDVQTTPAVVGASAVAGSSGSASAPITL